MKKISFYKIFLIATREFKVAVRKKTFLWMTILGPILLSAILIVPIWLGIDANATKKILVCDYSTTKNQTFNFDKNIVDITYLASDTALAKQTFNNAEYDALLLVNLEKYPAKMPVLYAKSDIGTTALVHINQQISDTKNYLLISKLTNDSTYKKILLSKINIQQNFVFDTNKNANSDLKNGIGLSLAVFIYFFIIMYGMQVMRGVQEEKFNRIVEVMATSVKPFEWMSGKILGIAAVSFFQFSIWITVTLLLSSFVSNKFQLHRFSNENIQTTMTKLKPIDYANALEMNKLVTSTNTISFIKIATVFIVYFVFGYLLYASLFAAIGAAVDSEADTQQFIFPLTLPLLLTFLFAQYMLQNPQSDAAFWLSLVPFTSPIAMLVRLPFDVSNWQLFFSISILIIFVFITIYISSKIYRTGLLMYGKKVTFLELVRWAAK